MTALLPAGCMLRGTTSASPFFDHVLVFSVADGRRSLRTYQATLAWQRCTLLHAYLTCLQPQRYS